MPLYVILSRLCEADEAARPKGKPMLRFRSIPARPVPRQFAALMCAALATAASAAAANADLTTLSLEQLMDLKVVGASKYEQSQAEVAAAVSIITRDEIRSFGWRTLDAALASLPGIHTTYDRQYTYLGTRGFGVPGDFNTRLLVNINGNRVNDALYDGGPMGSQFPLDMDLVERIEFIPGPGGAVYGQNAMFGVVNVITRSGSSMGGAELAAHSQHPQSLRAGRVSWGRKFDNGLDLVLSASGMRMRGEDRFFDYGAAGVSGVARGLDGELDKEFFARASHGPWSFDFVFGDRRKHDPTGAYLSDPLVPGQFQGDRYTLTQLQYQDRLLDDRLQVQARLFAGEDRYTSDLFYGTRFGFPGTGQWRGVDLRLLYTGFAAHKLMLGVEAQDNHRVDQQALDFTDPANDRLIQSPGSRTGVYAQDEWRIADTLTATLGLRVDKDSAVGTKLSPRAALIWQAAPTTTFKSLYGRAHRAPNAYERDYDDGFAQTSNPGLKGETIDTLEFVADHRIGSDLRLVGSAYQWTMHDLITLGIDPVSGISQYQSGSLVKARGLELSADKTWNWGGRLRGSVSLQRVRDDGGSRLLNSPQHLGKLHFSAPLPLAGLRLGYEWRYDGPRLTLDGSDSGGYAVSNLYLSTDKLAPGLDLSLGVANLFDKRYAHPGADTNWQNTLEQDGRSVRIEARLRF